MTPDDYPQTSRPLKALWLDRVRSWAICHPLLCVFVIALTARLSFALVIAITRGGALFPDDYGYLIMAKEFGLGQTQDWELFNWWGLWKINSGFLWPTSLIFRLFGFHPILAQILTALCGAMVAMAVTAIVRRYTSTASALFSGLVVALLPSQILWSSLFLKDAYSWMALCLLGLVHGWWSKQVSNGRFYQGLLALACLSYFLSHLRVHTFVVGCIAGLGAVLFTSGSRRPMRAVSIFLLLLFLPLTVGDSYFGADTISLGSNLDGLRTNMALGARTSIFDTTDPTSNLLGPIGGGHLEGFSYLPSGLRVMLLDPLPHQLHRSPNLKFAFAEHLLWYPLLLLAAVGVWRYRRRLSTDLAYTLLVTGGLTVMWGVVEGNFGTAYRHRGELVWGIAVFAGLGLEAIRESLRGRRQQLTTTIKP